MIEDCIILGGGVAGLSAANQLVDFGVSPLIIDAGKYPENRVCGEFFSHECLPILDRWEIPFSQQINICKFIRGNKQFEFSLPVYSKSCSRYDFDLHLLNRAKGKGARALTETRIVSIKPAESINHLHELHLSDGNMIRARNLMIGTGRIPMIGITQQKPSFQYVGFKAHFEGIAMGSVLEMHCFKGGYLGISQIDAKRANIACLFSKNYLDGSGSLSGTMENLKHDPSMKAFSEKLKNSRMIFPQWLTTNVPEFGIRTNPDLPNVFWIGDAAGSIPPLSGGGLAIAVTSGCMAADYFLRNDVNGFKKAWKNRYERRFFIAEKLHRLLLAHTLSGWAIRACDIFPKLPLYLWKLTR